MSTPHELFGLDGRVALVTGGSRGIGKMIAEAFLQSGARVYLTSRSAEGCRAAAQELSEHGECVAKPADVSNQSSLRQLVADLEDREQRLDILVNNAGAA